MTSKYERFDPYPYNLSVGEYKSPIFLFAAQTTFGASTWPLALDPAACIRYIKKQGKLWAEGNKKSATTVQ